MSTELQEGLGAFNIARDRAVEGTKQMTGKSPKYFGIGHEKEPRMYFPTSSINELDSQYGMDIAVVVPSNTKEFDLLAPAFGARLSAKEPKTIRNYLRKLLESV
jgi:hypothetical protein